MSTENPFHEGEVAVQTQAGERHNALLNSRMLADAIMPQALAFVRKQTWVILGAPDSEGWLWCSALMGEPGFAQPDPAGTEVHLDLRSGPWHPDNPLLAALSVDRPIGALFIELATRKRLRVNGRLVGISREHLQIAVEEAFPNCPKFIQKRAFGGTSQATGSPLPGRQGKALGPAEKALVTQADTCFVASAHPQRGVDTSHRGGKPGFLEVVGETRLRMPDYPGNGLFQTFGNLAVDDRSGWLIPDFATGGQLHLTGHARVVLGDPDPSDLTAGTNRFFELEVDQWHWTPPIQGAPAWSQPEASPFNP